MSGLREIEKSQHGEYTKAEMCWYFKRELETRRLFGGGVVHFFDMAACVTTTALRSPHQMSTKFIYLRREWATCRKLPATGWIRMICLVSTRVRQPPQVLRIVSLAFLHSTSRLSGFVFDCQKFTVLTLTVRFGHDIHHKKLDWER